MKTLKITKQFKKDIKKLKKQKKDLGKLKVVIDTISEGRTLNEKYLDHKLIGNFSDARECHLEPDWLLFVAAEKGRTIKFTGLLSRDF
ncbi:MAG: type II toxin-antitoxin system mRNA interferase toxin, RelE/StbE family [Proteobacteria bacterium]|nr:type II toxin-antitoxin system mRNA interferase toxin, RelE/StbE family [Pseudomonadota bacterium]